MDFAAFDTETVRFAPGRMAPPVVVLVLGDGRLVHRRDPEFRATATALVAPGAPTLVGVNVAYDLAALASDWPEFLRATFEALDRGAITDCVVRQKLADIATGCYWRGGALVDGKRYEYSLEDMCTRYGAPFVFEKGETSWRTRYGELADVPVRDWPEEARRYASQDGAATQWLVEAQERAIDPEHLRDQWNQTRHAFALHLLGVWGVRTSHAMVHAYAGEVARRMRENEARLIELGLLRRDVAKRSGKVSLHRDAKAAQAYAAQAYASRGLKPPTTPTGAIKLDEDACTTLGDELLIAYQALGSATATRSKPADLAAGILAPIHTRWDSLIATGRAASSNPPMMNRPVDPGDRECVIPRPGYVFIDEDYDGLELRTLAQSCLWLVGHSKLAEVLNTGGDPHAMVGASVLGISLDDMLRRKKDKSDHAAYEARQTGKIANFGLGGGLGWRALVAQARIKYGVTLDERAARNLIALWRETWPEMGPYFKLAESLTNGPRGEATIAQLVSRRVRGRIPYTELCNTWFQGLGADAAKSALYALVRECYVGAGPLREARPVLFIHDQVITEAPEEIAHECALAQSEIWRGVAQQWVPDVRMTSEPVLSRRWSKLAERRVDAHGRLVPWELTEEIARKNGCEWVYQGVVAERALTAASDARTLSDGG